jgi:PAS domain S-box-containing protein
MQLDLRTAVILIISLTLVLAVLVSAIRGIRRTYPGHRRWAIAGLLLVLSLLLLSLQSNPITANAGIVMASILYLEGAREFAGLAPVLWLAYAGGVITGGAVAFFYYVVPNMNARASVMSIFLGIVLMLVAIRLLRRIPFAHRFGQTFTGVMFALCAATLLARASYSYLGPPMSNRNATSGLYGLFFMAVVTEMAGFAVGITLMADERAISDLNDVKERVSLVNAEVAQHVEAEAVLRESEERFRTMADSAPVMIWISGLDKLCTFFNKPWLDFRGRTMEEELGSGWADGVHPEDRDRCLATYTSSFDARRSFQMEYRLLCADGEYRWILDNGTPLYRGGEFGGFIGSCINITGQKLIEERLRASEVQLLDAQRLGKLGSFERRIDTGRAHWSDELRRIYGVTRDAPAGFPEFLNRVHPKDRERMLETERYVRAARGPVEAEYRIIRPDGEVRLVRSVLEAVRNDQGEVVRITGACQDVTEQVRAQELLRESEERLKKAERLAHLGHWQWDVRTNRISGSEEMYQIFAQPHSQEPTYERFMHQLVPQDKDRVERAIQESLASKTGHSMEYQTAHPDGDVRTIACTWEVEQDEEGMPTRVFGTCQDITDSRRAQEASFARQKLESIGTLAGGIAHDFNNLLGGVAAQAELAKEQIADGSKPEEELGRIRDAAMRGSEIVRQLMIYAGKEGTVIELVDISRIVSEMLELLKVSVSKHAVLEADLGQDLPSVRANGAQLRQIVMNLVTNSSDAIGNRDGVIRVTTKWVKVGPDSPAGMSGRLAEGDYVQLEVSDTGRGMPPEIQAKVFDPFFTSKSAGHGLGLSIVDGIVRSLGGVIHLTSESGKGTALQISLPCAEIATGTSSDVVPRVVELARPSLDARILVVEDEDAIRQAVAKMLRNKGFEVLEASDGFSAIDFLRASGAEIDAILLDITIPGAESHEVAAEAAKARADVKVILTSAYSRDMIADTISAPQICGFIRKPFQIGVLEEMLRNTLSRS